MKCIKFNFAMVSCYLESVQWILTILLVFWLHRVDDQLEISKELELQITGAEKLSLWRLLGIQFIFLPYTLGKVCSLWLTCSTFTYWQLVKVANNRWHILCIMLTGFFWTILLNDWLMMQLATWQSWWIWQYWINQKSYTWEDVAFITGNYIKI